MPTRSASRQASAAGPQGLPCQQQTPVRVQPRSVDLQPLCALFNAATMGLLSLTLVGPLTSRSLEDLGVLAVRLFKRQLQRWTVRLLNLLQGGAIENDAISDYPSDARPMHRREAGRTVPVAHEELGPGPVWGCREAERHGVERTASGTVHGGLRNVVHDHANDAKRLPFLRLRAVGRRAPRAARVVEKGFPTGGAAARTLWRVDRRSPYCVSE